MKTVLTIVFISLLPQIVFDQTTSIPDANFEMELINFGYDIGPPDGVVLTASIDTVTSIDVSFESIVDLTGIEDFLALEILYCNNNDISNLNLTQNISLKRLNCGNNLLTILDVTQNPALVYLDCHSNEITSIDLTQNSQLEIAHCSSNNLTSLDLSGNSELEDLNCSVNFLTNLDVSQNDSLIYLHCEYNDITSLSINQNILLEYLVVNHNEIALLDLTNNAELKMLICHYNNLTSLDITNNPHVHSVICHHNELTCLDLKNGFFSFMGISNLQAEENPGLFCIEVDNVSWATFSYTSIDSIASFSTNCFNACSDPEVALEENFQKEFSIYPNPAVNGIIYVTQKNKSESTSYFLINSLGQIVLEGTITNNAIIDVSDFLGVFYLTVFTSSGIETKKILIL